VAEDLLPTDPDGGEPGEPGEQDEHEELDDLGLEGLLSETVVASASRTAETNADAPATTQVIRASDLRKYGIRTLDEAFNYLGLGIHAEGTGATGEVGVRGVTMAGDWGSHTLVLVDGHVVNDAAAGIVWFDRLAGIPMELVDRIELILGPGSVLYGNNAMLAVVSIVMKEGSDIDAVNVISEGSLSPNQNRSGNFEQLDWDRFGKRARFGLQVGKGFPVGKHKGDFILQAEYLNDRSPKYELGPQYVPSVPGLFSFGDNTGYEDPNIWGGYAGSRTQGVYGYTRLRLGDVTVSGRSSWLSPVSPNSSLEFDPDKGQTIVTSFADVRYDYVISSKVSGLARVYGDHFLFRQDLVFPAQAFCGAQLAPCELVVATESARGGLESQWSFDWFADDRFKTMIGVDGRVRNNTGQVYFEDPNGNVSWEPGNSNYDIFDQALGAYLQQILRVHPKVSFNAGLRYDYLPYAQAFSPRVAANFQTWEGGTLKLIYSQAFRAPNRTELAEASNLDPEVVKSAEVSLSQRIGRHRLTASAFGSLWSDIIQRSIHQDPNNPGAFDVGYRNANHIVNLGGNLAYSGQVKRWDFGLNASYGYARVRLGGLAGSDDLELTDQELTDLGFSRQAANTYGRDQPLSAAPSVVGNARVAYSFGGRGPTVGFATHLLGPRLIKDVYQRAELLTFVNEGRDVVLPTRVMGRLTVSGDIARFRPVILGWRAGVDATSTVHTPQTVGPFRSYYDGNGYQRIELNQIPRLTVFAGMTLGFGPVGKKGEK
jgi:outer membrane cobalamin receptor